MVRLTSANLPDDAITLVDKVEQLVGVVQYLALSI
jgi:hypothetical protein